MWKYLKTSKHRPGMNAMSMPIDGKSATAVRVGVPLTIALLSVFGWYASLLAKQSTPARSDNQTPVSRDDQDIPRHMTTAADPDTATTDLQVKQSQSADNSTTETKLYINSEEVSIPGSGSVHKVIQSDTSTTTVDVSVDAEADGLTEQSSSMNVEVHSQSETDMQVGNKEGP